VRRVPTLLRIGEAMGCLELEWQMKSEQGGKHDAD
jgi:hypothetical protein